ncbi:MAG: cyclic nucleotide-binding domain-containing protein, partial [Phaeodactylibacter sp.]|nr:cyclic nucleotide-binding domain-containing protein [Phaeodactylibacter sp.]
MNPDSSRIIDLLRQHFPNIAERELIEEIAEVGKILSFEAGETIMDYGSYIRLMPLVISGSVKVLREDEDGNELFLYYLGSGETCSMSFSCCVMHKKSVIRTVAEDDTEFI